MANSRAGVAEVGRSRALTTRALDFWLLGGASLVVWIALVGLAPFRAASWAVDHHFQNLAAISATLALVCNYPHFMASYKLAYAQGLRFVGRYWFALAAVPVLLVAAMVGGYRLWDAPAGAASPLLALSDALRALGLDTEIGRQSTSGRELMGLLTNFMFFTVGWHYSKQVYGCMVVYATYDGYRLDTGQRRVIKSAVFAVWFASYAHANRHGGYQELLGIPYLGLGLPAWTYPATMVFLVATLIALVWAVVYRNYEHRGLRPSLSFLVPYAAFVAWWTPPLLQVDFYLLLVPLFHGLQYLPFVYRIERARLATEHPRSATLRGSGIALGLVAAGFLAFELIPNAADAALNTQETKGAWLFFASAHLFINIHHYFIDSVIWRFRNRSVQDWLIGAASPESSASAI